MNKYIYAAIAVIAIYFLWMWNKNRPATLPVMRKPGELVPFKMQAGDVGYSGQEALNISRGRTYESTNVVIFDDCFIPWDTIVRGDTLYINICERATNLVRLNYKNQ